jgi:hypothetical protein
VETLNFDLKKFGLEPGYHKYAPSFDFTNEYNSDLPFEYITVSANTEYKTMYIEKGRVCIYNAGLPENQQEADILFKLLGSTNAAIT